MNCKNCGAKNDDSALVCAKCGQSLQGGADLDIDFDSILKSLAVESPDGDSSSESGAGPTKKATSDDSIFAELGIETEPPPVSLEKKSESKKSGEELFKELDAGGLSLDQAKDDLDDIFKDLGLVEEPPKPAPKAETRASASASGKETRTPDSKLEDDIFKELGIDTTPTNIQTKSEGKSEDLFDIENLINLDDDSLDPLAGLKVKGKSDTPEPVTSSGVQKTAPSSKAAPRKEEPAIELGLEDLSLGEDDPLAGLLMKEEPKKTATPEKKPSSQPAPQKSQTKDVDPLAAELGLDLADLSLGEDDPLAALLAGETETQKQPEKQVSGPSKGVEKKSPGKPEKTEVKSPETFDLGIDLEFETGSKPPSKTPAAEAKTVSKAGVSDIDELLGDLVLDTPIRGGGQGKKTEVTEKTGGDLKVSRPSSEIEAGPEEKGSDLDRLLGELVEESEKKVSKGKKDDVIDFGEDILPDVSDIFAPPAAEKKAALKPDTKKSMILDELATLGKPVSPKKEEPPVVLEIAQPAAKEIEKPEKIELKLEVPKSESAGAEQTGTRPVLDLTGGVSPGVEIPLEPLTAGEKSREKTPAETKVSPPPLQAEAKPAPQAPQPQVTPPPGPSPLLSMTRRAPQAEAKLKKPATEEKQPLPEADEKAETLEELAVMPADSGEREELPLEEVLARLQKAREDDEKYALVHRLGELADERAVPVLIQMLSDLNKDIRETVIEALGKIKSVQAVEPLVSTLLSETDPDIAYLIVRALGEIRNPQAIDALLKALYCQNEDLAYIAAVSLGKIGSEKVVPDLVGLLNEPNPDMRRVAVEALGAIGSPQALQPLIGMLRDLDSEVRAEAARALGIIKDEGAVSSLSELLSDPEEKVRLAAVKALSELKAGEVVDSLTALLEDSSQEIVIETVKALGEIGEERAIEPLVDALSRADEQLKVHIARALGKLRATRASSTLMRQLDQAGDELRLAIVEALGEIGTEDCVEGLVKTLHDKNEQVRQKAVIALGKIATSDAVDSLIAVLADPNDEVRMNSVEALGRIRDQRAIKPLIKILDDRNEAVAERASWSLVEIGESAVLELVSMLDVYNEKPDYEMETGVQKKIIRILGKIGDVRAVIPLVSQLEGAGKEIVEAIADALADIDAHIRKISEDNVRLKEAIAWTRLSIAKALGRIKDERAPSVLISMMMDTLTDREMEEYENEEPPCFTREILKNLQRTAAELVGQFGDESTADELARIFKGARYDVKRWLVYALGEIGSTRAIDALVDILKDANSGVEFRDTAVALSRIKDERIVNKLFEMLRTAESFGKKGGAYALGLIRDPRSINALSSLTVDADEEVRLNAVEALGKIGTEMIIQPVTKALRDVSWRVRKAAVKILGGLRAVAAIEPLNSVLKDENEAVRQAVVTALGRIQDDRIPMILIRMLKDPSEEVRSRVVYTLGGIRDARAVEPLVEMLRDTSGKVRREVTEALGKIGELSAIVPLLTALDDEDSLVRAKALESLKMMGTRAIPKLVEAMKDENERIRQNATATLSKFKYKASIPHLITGLEDRNWFMRENCATVLGEIASPRAVEALIPLLRDRHTSVREKAAWALGQIGDVRALVPLKAAQRDQHRNVRKMATEALAKIAGSII